MAFGTLQDNVAVAGSHLQTARVEGTGAFITGKIVETDTHNNQTVCPTHQIFVAVAIVYARIEGRVGVNLAVGIPNRHMAAPLFAAGGKGKGCYKGNNKEAYGDGRIAGMAHRD